MTALPDTHVADSVEAAIAALEQLAASLRQGGFAEGASAYQRMAEVLVAQQLFHERDSQAVYLLSQQGVSQFDLKRYVSHGAGPEGEASSDMEEDESDDAGLGDEDEEGGGAARDPLKAYTVDLTDNRGDMDRIYVFRGADGPIAGIACLGSCERTITVTVTHPEAETPSE